MEASIAIQRGELECAARKVDLILSKYSRDTALKRLAVAQSKTGGGEAVQAIQNLGQRIDALIEIARVSGAESDAVVYGYVAEALRVALSSRCPYDIERVLAELAGIGRGNEMIAWLSYLDADPATWYRVAN